MPIVSVTRLKLRSLRFLPAFAFHNWRTMRQARASDNMLGGTLAVGRGFSFWTITAWHDEAAMLAYRNGGAHGRVMAKLKRWCSEASVVRWTAPDARLPSVTEAARRLGDEGKLSKVRAPSPGQAAGAAWPDGRVPVPGLALAPAPGARVDGATQPAGMRG